MEGLTEGRIVHFVMPDGQHRPAIVVRVWRDLEPEKGVCQLQVFTDGTNDCQGFDLDGKHYVMGEDCARGLVLANSILYSETKEPRTWHWIEKA